MVQAAISFTADDDPPALGCPKCGGANLHQEDVVVYTRKEDERVTRVTTVSGQDIHTRLKSSEDSCNPSPRRQGLRIEFSCETCESQAPSWLLIWQHKGSTHIAWEKAP